MDYLITTNGILKSLGGKKILKDVNLNIAKGKVYGLLGSNGAGKSTIMKIIAGIITKYEGNVTFKNKVWSRDVLNKIGFLIEYPSLYDNLNAYDNLKIISLEEDVSLDRINVVLEECGINDTGSKKIKDFSLGMKQRLGIAIAILKDPEFVILDEPFNGLDPYGIRDLKTYLKKLKNSGKTILISSHILSEIQDISDNIGILNNGNIVYEGECNNEIDLQKIFFDKTEGDYQL